MVISAFLYLALLGNLALARSQEVEEETAPEPFVEPSQPRAPISAGTGFASFYHAVFHGRRTANGETFNRHALTAAHKTLPFGTFVRVINLRNDRSVIVRVNDRGPLHKNRVIDVSPRAARELGFLAYGVTWVKLELMAADDLSDLAEK
ncbi:MAG: septal ring lytic transglycosylase RlpA family protein [Candidatus Binatia bacterium]